MKEIKHPETCWVFIPSDNSIGVVKWEKNGYYETDYPHNYTYEIVEQMNDMSGFSRNEIKAMQYCSMASLPETEEAWEKHYKMCLSMMDK